MLFASHTVKTLTADHHRILIETEILKNIDISLTERRLAFARLLPVFISHSRREERVIYTFMKNTRNVDLQDWAVHGFEEHQVLDRLITKMLSDEITHDEWTAKARALAYNIEDHLNEEELEIFPELQDELDAETDLHLSKEYEKKLITDTVLPPYISHHNNILNVQHPL
ncbi:MAG: hemerythrin domain-containing protein [Pseudobdellovibrio sp.]